MTSAVSRVLEFADSGKISCSFKRDEMLSRYTSLGIGGAVGVMFFPASVVELTELFDALRELEARPFILGRGTNLLADDRPLDLVMINTTGLDAIESVGETRIAAGAGIQLSALAVYAYKQGLSGLEFAHGIPGTLGGAIVMNAGAYDGEMKDIVELTYAVNAEAGAYIAKGAEHGFAYRHSRFMETGDVITSSLLCLQDADPIGIKSKMDDLADLRKRTQPLDMPSAGSVFKRPKEGYAAALIDQAGLRGYRVGGAQISIKHAGFIINRGKATFSDVMTVIDHARETVLRLFGVELELEIVIIRNEARG